MNQPNEPTIDRAMCQRGQAAEAARRLLAEIVRDCGASEATLWLISPDGRHMLGTLNHGPDHDIIERESVPADNSVVGMVAANGQPVSIGPDDEHNPKIDQLTGTPTAAMIVAPVDVAGRRCGALSAINPKAGGLFGADSLETLRFKAMLLGLLLDHFADGN